MVLYLTYSFIKTSNNNREKQGKEHKIKIEEIKATFENERLLKHK
jgi:hypothetical protein